MNNKGGTLTAWIFSIILILLFILILQGQVLDNLNEIYGSDFQTGLNTSALDDFNSLKENSDTTLEGAEATSSSDGLTLKDSWTIGKSAYKTLVTFVSGNFISNLLTDILDFPPVVANTLIVMIWLSLIMIIIYIFMKVVP